MTIEKLNTADPNSSFTNMAQSVVTHWFGESLTNPAALRQKYKLWFNPSKADDEKVKARFGSRIQPVADATPQILSSARDGLAAVIMLDQFPRQVYRGTRQAFAYDKHAFACLSYSLDRQWHNELHPLKATFLFMPCMHTETLAQQELGVQLYTDLLKRTPSDFVHSVQQSLDFAKEHRDIISRFGRFPHRNEALGRRNTEEEANYLRNGANRYGQ